MILYPRRWRFLFSDSGVLLLTSLFSMVIASGDYLILGAMKGKVQAGYLYFAFNLSFQTLVLLTVNLSPVLFPALARLAEDPKRQAQAYIRALQVLALVGAPACFLQAALVEPGFRLLFRPTWNPAMAITQYLSLAMAVRVMGMTIFNFTNAQGRFKLQCVLSGISCLLFVASVAIASYFGGAREVAATESIFFVVVETTVLGIVLGINGFSAPRELAKIFVAPLVAAGVAVGAACYAGGLMPMHDRLQCILRISVITVVSAILYLPLIRVLAREPWREMADLVLRMLKRAPRQSAA
jgi:PST family polysaccharide transporter